MITIVNFICTENLVKVLFMRKVVIIYISLEKAINQNRSHKVICISVIIATKMMITIKRGVGRWSESYNRNCHK